MAGLRRFGSHPAKPGERPAEPRPSNVVPRRDGDPASRVIDVTEETPSFGEIDFDSIGLVPEGRSRLIVPPKDPGANEETRIAGMGVIARAIADSIEPPPASHPRPSRVASDVVPSRDRIGVMRELYAQGNAEAALAIASELVPAGRAPSSAQRDDRTAIASSPVSGRLAAFTSQKVPRLVIAQNEIASLPIDPRAAFIVGHVDGIQSMGDILDICAMPESEALELFARLQHLGVIVID